jgi:hypothetical protein
MLCCAASGRRSPGVTCRGAHMCWQRGDWRRWRLAGVMRMLLLGRSEHGRPVPLRRLGMLLLWVWQLIGCRVYVCVAATTIQYSALKHAWTEAKQDEAWTVTSSIQLVDRPPARLPLPCPAHSSAQSFPHHFLLQPPTHPRPISLLLCPTTNTQAWRGPHHASPGA